MFFAVATTVPIATSADQMTVQPCSKCLDSVGQLQQNGGNDFWLILLALVGFAGFVPAVGLLARHVLPVIQSPHAFTPFASQLLGRCQASFGAQ